jgi:hypothetical protein
MDSSPNRTVFDDIREFGHDEDFEPQPAVNPCPYPARTKTRIEFYAARVRRGEDIFCHEDFERE